MKKLQLMLDAHENSSNEEMRGFHGDVCMDIKWKSHARRKTWSINSLGLLFLCIKHERELSGVAC